MLLIISLISLFVFGINDDIYDEVKNARNFTGKVVLITGSSSGIGAVTAKLFSSLGANVVITGRNATNVKRVANETYKLSPIGLNPLEVIADLTIDGDIERLINETIKRFGKLDILVNNAGIGDFSPISSSQLMQTFDSIFQTNLRAPLYLTHLSVPFLEKSKGTIINISSGLSIIPLVPLVAYCMSKAALDMMSKVLSVELGSSGIRVNTINPGKIDTEGSAVSEQFENEQYIKVTPLRRVGEPMDVAKGIAFLASTDSQFITGANLVIDGGIIYNLNANFLINMLAN